MAESRLPIPDTVLQEAFDHLLHLCEQPDDILARRRLQRWLEQSSLHRQAWAKAKRTWDISNAMGSESRPSVLTWSLPVRPTLMMLAACLVLSLMMVCGLERGDLFSRPNEIREARLEDGSKVPGELGELRVGEPQGGHAVAGAVPDGVDGAVGQVAVGVSEHPGDVGHEGLHVFFGGHGRGLARLDLRGEQTQRVGTLDRATDPALGHHLEHPGIGEPGDVTVQAPGGHVVEFGGELARGQRPVTEERLDYAKPHRVQQQIRACHG